MSSQACRSLVENSPSSRRTSAFRTTSPSGFFESPTAACPCPGSGRQPTSSAARSPAELLHLLCLAYVHAAVLGLPGVDGVLADSMGTGHVLGRLPGFHLLQRLDDLRFGVLTLAQRLSLPFVSNRISIRTILGDHVKLNPYDPSALEELKKLNTK